MMSNEYLNFRLHQIPIALLRGLWSKKFLKKIEVQEGLSEYDPQNRFRGLSFIFLGFLIQFFCEVYKLIFS